MSSFPELERCRIELAAARTEARVAAKQLEASMMKPVQDATDRVVLAAVEAGLTRTAVAASLGESRSTLNERLDRATGGKGSDVTAEYTQDSPPYHVTGGGGELSVDWVDYGPDRITANNTMDIIRDEDTGTYWFMSEPAGTVNEVNMKLDTIFTGWYYEDAAKFVAKSMEEE